MCTSSASLCSRLCCNTPLSACPASTLLQTLLDNLEGEIDRGDAKLQRETARVDHAMKESRTCWLYTAICLLLVVLLALVLVRWA